MIHIPAILGPGESIHYRIGNVPECRIASRNLEGVVVGQVLSVKFGVVLEIRKSGAG
jgi:hypothetical protein